MDRLSDHVDERTKRVDQQVTLLCDAWRVAKPGADHVQWELTLEFCLPASSHRMEQSWPTRNTGAAQESCHLGL